MWYVIVSELEMKMNSVDFIEQIVEVCMNHFLPDFNKTCCNVLKSGGDGLNNVYAIIAVANN